MSFRPSSKTHKATRKPKFEKYILQKEKANFYSGVKIIRITDEQITTFNPTIGGEYIFGEHFSIGSEIGFPFAIANKDAAIGFGFNRLILRFYP